MSDYVTLIALDTPLGGEDIRRLAGHGCLALHRITWVRAYLAADGARLLCWYRAVDAESVRLAVRQQGLGRAMVWSAGVDGETAAESLDRAEDCVVVEVCIDSKPRAEQVTPIPGAVRAALEAAGHTVSRTFAPANHDRAYCVVRGDDEAAVKACLRSAGVAPIGVWIGSEISPRPHKLYEGLAPAAVEPTRRPESGARRLRSGSPEGAGEDVDAIIIGAGVGGLCALRKLRDMGLSVRVYEGASDVGGVWYWNGYPGARVDSESYTYAFSFSEDLVREWDWTEMFPPQPEILRYLRHVTDRFELRRHIRFDTRVRAAVYDPHGRRWLVETDNERVAARYLIPAVGTLAVPQLPDYPGWSELAGEIYHTARWPAHPVELDGKRVGVIGTGATGVQVIQTIAAQVAHLTVFQRSPTYCLPQRNTALSDEQRRQIKRDWAGILARCRSSYGGFIHDFEPTSGLAVSAAEREANFEALWQTPGLAFWLGNYADLVMDEEVNAHASEFLRRKIRERVRDPELAEKLLPDHPFGAKRVPLENGYYEVFNRDNVELVDLRESPIERLTPSGIRTSRGEHALDVLICATGFDAVTGGLTQIDIRGEGGLTIAQKWSDSPRTALGLQLHGFPNLFLVSGPQNAAALCNAVRCIESNVDWIAQCIDYMRAHGRTRIEPTVAAETQWTEHVEEAVSATLVRGVTDSWFFGCKASGKPRRIMIYVAGGRVYREHIEAVARDGYPGFTLS